MSELVSAVGERAVPAHPVAVPEEARADHVVGAAARHGVEHGRRSRRGRTRRRRRGTRRPRSPRRARGRGRCAAPRRAPADDGCEITARAVLAADGGGGVARAVVHQQHVDGHPAGLGRQPGEHAAQARLLVAGHHHGERAAGRGAVLDAGVELGHHRPAPRRRGGLHAQQRGHRGRQLADRARLAAHRAGPRPGAPDHERHRPLAPVEVAVAADPPPLAVVGHQDHGGAVELAALLEEARGSRPRGGRSPRAGRGTRGCARRARGRAGRRPAAGARAGPGPPPRPPGGPRRRASGRSGRWAAPR